MSSDGLKDKYRQAIIEQLAANPRVQRVVLFGSRATGTFSPSSDIDLALFGDQLTLDDQANLSAAIEQLTVPQQVDLIRYHAVTNAQLRALIDSQGVEWFTRQ